MSWDGGAKEKRVKLDIWRPNFSLTLLHSTCRKQARSARTRRLTLPKPSSSSERESSCRVMLSTHPSRRNVRCVHARAARTPAEAASSRSDRVTCAEDRRGKGCGRADHEAQALVRRPLVPPEALQCQYSERCVGGSVSDSLPYTDGAPGRCYSRNARALQCTPRTRRTQPHSALERMRAADRGRGSSRLYTHRQAAEHFTRMQVFVRHFCSTFRNCCLRSLSYVQVFLRMLQTLKPGSQDNIQPHCPTLLLFTTSAQTHIFPEIRVDAIRFLNLFLNIIPETVVAGWTEQDSVQGHSHGSRVLEGYLGILNAGTSYGQDWGRPIA
jgi:hypothetical protein